MCVSSYTYPHGYCHCQCLTYNMDSQGYEFHIGKEISFFYISLRFLSCRYLLIQCPLSTPLVLWNVQEIYRGNMLWRPSCRHIWSRVNVPPNFVVVKPAKQVWVAFPPWTKSCAHNGYRVTIMHADRAEWSCQIRSYNNLPPYVTVNMATAP